MNTGNNDIDVSSKEFAITLHNKWGVGSRELQNGILIFLSKLDRSIYISIGKGTEKFFSDVVIDYLINVMKPRLRKEEYGVALQELLIEIDMILSGKRSNTEIELAMKRERSSTDTGILVFILIFLSIWAYAFIVNYYQVKRLERGKAALERVMREVPDIDDEPSENTTTQKMFRSKSCPICLEDFSTNNTEVTVEVEDESKEIDEEKDNLIYDRKSEEFSRDETKVPSPLNEDSASNASTIQREDRPVALRCGHIFCYKCLKSLVQGDNHKCPICRLPIDDRDGSHPSRETSHSLRGVGDSSPFPTSCSTSSSLSRRAPEIRYRLNRMHHLYPDVVTMELLRSMNSAIDRNSSSDLRQAITIRRTEVQNSITRIREQTKTSARSSGSHGASRSFGGGSSSRGGGGRW